MEIGFMQGRLISPVDGRIQAFPAGAWRDEFPIAADCEFRVMEWTVDRAGFAHNPLLTAEGRAEIGTLGRRHGLSVPSVTADCFMQAPVHRARGQERTRRVAELRALFNAAHALDRALVVLPLVDGGALRGADDERLLFDVLMETTNRGGPPAPPVAFESDYPPERLARLIEAYPAAGFGVNYDTGNSAACGYAPADELAAYGARVMNVHIKDRPRGGSSVPLGEGDVDFPSVFRGLAEAGYRGNFILQTARAADGDHAGAALRYRRMVEGWLGEAGWTWG